MTEEKTSFRWLEYIVLFSMMVLIIALSFMLLPFSIFLAVLIPLPVLIATYRHNMIHGVVISALASIFFIFFVMDITIVILIVALATVGIGIGVAMKEKLDYQKILAVGVVSALITVSLIGLGLYLATGQTPTELFEGTTAQMIEDISSRDLPNMQLAIDQVEATIASVRLLFPSLIIIGAVFVAGANFLVGSAVLRRLKMEDVPSLPPITNWAFPAWLSIVFLVLWPLSRFSIFPSSIAVIIANLTNVFSWLLIIQGLSIILSFMKSVRMPTWIKVLIILPLWLFGGWFLSLLGALDPWLRFRGRLSKYQDELKEQREKNKRN